MKGRFPVFLVLALLLLFSPSSLASHSKTFQTVPDIADAPLVFEAPLPPARPAEADWFSDAVFIGDGRVEELLACASFQPKLSLAQMGLNVRDVRSEAVLFLKEDHVSLSQALTGSGCSKIYLMLGFNEAAWMDEQEFYLEYSGLIDDLRALLPNAQIYLQTLIPVTVTRAGAQSPGNALLADRNLLLTRLAHAKQVYLVDVGGFLTQSNGSLASELSSDGLHLNQAGNEAWLTYLQTHTMRA